MKDDQAVELVRKALAVQPRAYAPYSRFAVGAAVAAGEQIFCGCNVENASYGLTICAERVALAAMVVAGRHQATAIAIASLGGVAPCGACRQVLLELAPQATVLLVDVQSPETWRTTTVAELLPDPFV